MLIRCIIITIIIIIFIYLIIKWDLSVLFTYYFYFILFRLERYNEQIRNYVFKRRKEVVKCLENRMEKIMYPTPFI